MFNLNALRIGVFSYGLPVVGEKRGGIERVAHDLAEGLARRGHEVTVWTYDPIPAGANYAVRALPWRRWSTSWLGRRLTMGYGGNLLALLPRYIDCDAIIAHGDSVLLPLLGKPLIRVMHGSALGESLSASSPWRLVLQLGVYVQELLTALTQPGCVAVSQNTLRHNPFVRHVIPNGVDLTSFYPDSSSKTSQPSVLFVGALDGRKRGGLLIEWFIREVRPQHPSARLMMVSHPGPKFPGVTYYTGISSEELAALYQRAWVYASLSTYEGFGLPYLEAMASGTPVIATPNPGSREVLADGHYGCLVEDAGFGRALVDLLADAGARADLAKRGLGRVQDYSLNNMIAAYERLLFEMCLPAPHFTETDS